MSSVKKSLADIQNFIHGAEDTPTSPTSVDNRPSPYTMVFKLQQCAPAFLKDPDALDLFIEVVPRIESYRGKGSQILIDGIPKVLLSILVAHQFQDPPDPEADVPPSTQTTLAIFKKIAELALIRVQGNGKAVRSRRSAQLRESYWQILTDISEDMSFPDVLDLAMQVAPDAKASLPERTGAIAYLLNYLSFEDAPGDEPTTAKANGLIATIRENPPSRDILFQILDSEVNSGEIDEMTALFDLKKYDER